MHTYVNVVVVGPRRFPQVMLGPHVGQQHLDVTSDLYAVLNFVQSCLASNYREVLHVSNHLHYHITATIKFCFMFISNQSVH